MMFKAEDVEMMVKAVSLECLGPQTIKRTKRNEEIIEAINEIDKEFKSCDCESERIPILARVYDLCLIMDVI